MHSSMARTLGFAVPTVAMVTAGHLIAQNTVGEAIDGVVSGLWFTALFGVGAGLRGWLDRGRAASVATSPRRAALDGLLLGALTWGGLWAFWSVVPHRGPNFPATLVFVAQSTLMSVVGALSPGFRSGRTRRIA